MTKPNILVIMTDQQSATMMSCTGNPWLKTPAMDHLAANGIRFERAYCTNPVCMPSRFSLLSGLMPGDRGMRYNHNITVEKDDQIIEYGLGKLLKEAGYQAAYAGKTHLPHGMQPKDIGFEYLDKDERDQLATTCADYIKSDSDQPFCLFASLINPHDICYMAIRDFMQSDHDRIIITNGKIECRTLDKAMQFPEGVSEEEFFASLCPPLPENHHVQEDEPEALKMLLEQRNFRHRARHEYTDKEWRMHRWAYCRLTEFVDTQIGQILTALKESGKEEETIIIFTSDHGDHDSSHKLEHKTAFYEEAARVPLIVTGKGIPPRINNTDLISNGLDLIPTICDYAGCEIPPHLSGKSIRPIVENKCGEWREYLPVENEIGRMVITDRYKYMVHDLGDNHEQLMDLHLDPYETRNFATDTGNDEILEQHRTIFNTHFKDWNLPSFQPVE